MPSSTPTNHCQVHHSNDLSIKRKGGCRLFGETSGPSGVSAATQVATDKGKVLIALVAVEDRLANRAALPDKLFAEQSEQGCTARQANCRTERTGLYCPTSYRLANRAVLPDKLLAEQSEQGSTARQAPLPGTVPRGDGDVFNSLALSEPARLGQDSLFGDKNKAAAALFFRFSICHLPACPGGKAVCAQHWALLLRGG